MRTGAGKRKGSAFERSVYKKLRTVFPECKRSLGSGSSDEPADAITFKYNFECKFRKKITSKMLEKWWNKLLEDSEKNNNTPILIFKSNYERIKTMEYYKDDITHMLDFEDWLGIRKKEKKSII